MHTNPFINNLATIMEAMNDGDDAEQQTKTHINLNHHLVTDVTFAKGLEIIQMCYDGDDGGVSPKIKCAFMFMR